MAQYIEDSSLEGWEPIGSGGFGQVYKGRHRQLACDVAVKLLRPDDGTNELLLREVSMMRQGSSPHVVHVYGVFRGRPPSSGATAQLGVVMELMDRGSLFSLQETLGGPPPWPLVFRLAHQVALGLNFLHSLRRPVLHLDLKPHNVLLDDGLNAKLTDFGLSRVSHSVSLLTKDRGGVEGGTTSYMPPEAFALSYEPRRASDIYSYGVLLWSLVTGKQPYPNAPRRIVENLVPEGQRPPLKDIEAQAARVEGLTGLKELMVRCWDNERERRPRTLECTTEAEKLFEPHRPAVPDAVYEVLKKLKTNAEERLSDHGAQASVEDIQQSGASAGLDTFRLVNGAEQSLRREDMRRYFCELTVDTNTVNTYIVLSDNNRKMSYVLFQNMRELMSWTPARQHYPDHPDRFDSRSQLLCRDALTGRCYWEVEWSGGVCVAVSYRGISRKGLREDSGFGENDQSWSLSCSGQGYSVCHNNRKRSIPPSSFSSILSTSIFSMFSPSSGSGRVAVYVDCPAGTLSFYRVSSDTLSHLHTFNTTFTEPLYPGFMVWSSGSSVSLCPLSEMTSCPGV